MVPEKSSPLLLWKLTSISLSRTSQSRLHPQSFHKSQVPGEAFVAAAKVEERAADRACALFRRANLMLPRPMREFIWTDVMYNPNVERERKGGRHAKKVSGRGTVKTFLFGHRIVKETKN